MFSEILIDCTMYTVGASLMKAQTINTAQPKVCQLHEWGILRNLYVRH
jgi:hypothetical protein